MKNILVITQNPELTEIVRKCIGQNVECAFRAAGILRRKINRKQTAGNFGKNHVIYAERCVLGVQRTLAESVCCKNSLAN
jgi:hypothetical protein